MMVVDGEFAELAARSISAATPTTKLMLRERELGAWKARPETGVAPYPREPSDPAFWVMTSGTTGRPKAVEHRHANVGICAQYFEQVLDVKPADRLFGTSRFHFAYALGTMFAALRLGATNILLERWATAESVAATVERHAPTVFLSVPALYHKLIDAGLAQTPAFRAVRHYVSAGERLPPRMGGGERPSDPRRVGVFRAGLHGDRQYASVTASRLLRAPDAGRRGPAGRGGRDGDHGTCATRPARGPHAVGMRGLPRRRRQAR